MTELKLPKAHKGERTKVKSLLIISRPKVGKTHALMGLPDSILLDLNESADYYDGTSIDLIAETKRLKTKSPVITLKKYAKMISDQNLEAGKHVYKYGILDTATDLEDYCLKLATMRYRATPEGQLYKGQSILADLGYGKGYSLVQAEFRNALAPLFSLFDCFIITGHVKDSSITFQGRDISARDIDLIGKTKLIVSSEFHNIATMYRDPDKQDVNILSFITQSTDVITGSRAGHLSGRKFEISEYDKETEVLTTHWDKIFLPDSVAVTA